MVPSFSSARLNPHPADTATAPAMPGTWTGTLLGGPAPLSPSRLTALLPQAQTVPSFRRPTEWEMPEETPTRLLSAIGRATLLAGRELAAPRRPWLLSPQAHAVPSTGMAMLLSTPAAIVSARNSAVPRIG